MKFHVNNINLTVEVLKKQVRENKAYLLVSICGSNKSKARGIVVISLKKLNGKELEVGKKYNLNGFLKNTLTKYDEFEFNTTICAYEITDFKDGDEVLNKIELVCNFNSRGLIKEISNDRTICELNVDFVSPNMKNSKCIILVWNKAIDALYNIKKGEPMFLVNYIYEELKGESNIGYKLSPYKITAL